MKRLIFMTAAFAVCMLSMAQSDSYTMQVYLSGGDVQSFSVSDVDSVVFVETADESSSSNTNYINGHEAVDLGLSVKWATCNIGADSPEDYGNYYAWGEIETKSSYTAANSVYYGVEIDDIAGNADYDAATANWGSTWRMPTWDEIVEIVYDCTWEWTTQNDVNGCLVTGSNGNSIFFPAASYRTGTSLGNAGNSGRYWCSMTDSSTSYGYLFGFDSGGPNLYWMYRYYGLPVRPVTE